MFKHFSNNYCISSRNASFEPSWWYATQHIVAPGQWLGCSWPPFRSSARHLVSWESWALVFRNLCGVGDKQRLLSLLDAGWWFLDLSCSHSDSFWFLDHQEELEGWHQQDPNLQMNSKENLAHPTTESYRLILGRQYRKKQCQRDWPSFPHSATGQAMSAHIFPEPGCRQRHDRLAVSPEGLLYLVVLQPLAQHAAYRSAPVWVW